jgi:toxin ParE1/3/4
MKYRVSKRALADIEAIGHYVARDNETAAYRLIEAFFHRMDMFQRVPRAGVRRDDLGPGYRAVPVGQYLILYKVGDTRIEVLRVIHGKRNIAKALRFPDKP